MNTQPPTAASTPRQGGRSPVTFAVMVVGGMLAAGVGGYVAQSQRQTELPVAEARGAQPTAAASAPANPSAVAPAPAPASPAQVEPAPAVAEAAPAITVDPAATPRAAEPVERATKPTRQAAAVRPAQEPVLAQPTAAPSTPARSADPAPAVEVVASDTRPVQDVPPTPPAAPAAAAPEPAAPTQSARVTIRETVVVPADSVMGLEITQSVSSESAQVEDRVDARVTRDVRLDGTLVVPAGAKVIGDVIRVENGGRFKERGRLGIRFHTLILADGEAITIETDPIFREGDNVGRKASARIGASAAGGAIIGAIFGGEKGAAIGAAAGAGAGTAVTASQKPSEARFRAGSIVTVRLTAPVEITLGQ